MSTARSFSDVTFVEAGKAGAPEGWCRGKGGQQQPQQQSAAQPAAGAMANVG